MCYYDCCYDILSLYHLHTMTRRAKLAQVEEDPSCEHHLYWPCPPDTVLVVKKIRDTEVTVKFKTIVRFLMNVSKYVHALEAAHFSFVKSDYLGCVVLLCLVVCLTLLASFFLPSFISH